MLDEAAKKASTPSGAVSLFLSMKWCTVYLTSRAKCRMRKQSRASFGWTFGKYGLNLCVFCSCWLNLTSVGFGLRPGGCG
jgi:hypothetical protein